MKSKEIIEFRKKLMNTTLEDLKDNKFLNQLSKLHLSILDSLNFINPKRKPICLKEAR